MAFERKQTIHLIRNEDLNYHGTLFAGRCAEWLVESGFVTVSSRLNLRNVVCLKIHGVEFFRPVRVGEQLVFESAIVWTGKSTILVYTRLFSPEYPDCLYAESFITYCYVNDQTRPVAHNISVVAESEVEACLQNRALRLSKLH